MEKIPNQGAGTASSREGVSKDKIIERIEQESGFPNIAGKLAEMPSTDFQSLFLNVVESKSDHVGVKEIREVFEKSPYIKSSEIDQSIFAKLDNIAYSLLPEGYAGVELSPLSPFGTNKVLAGISQNRVLTTTRNSEVVSDPTTALALHCANERSKRLKIDQKDSQKISAATSLRVSRQNQLKKESQRQHFRSFTVMSAGRDVGFETFEKESFTEHISYFLNLISALNSSGDYAIGEVRVKISDVSDKNTLLDILESSVVEILRTRYPNVEFPIDNERKSNYYNSLCYTILARNTDQQEFSLVGGGMTDWTQKLVGSKKERLLFGSLGSEVLCGNFINKKNNV